jgi:thioredoxin-like negative regulator of GroEL
MKLVSGVSLIVSVALFAQVWAGTPESAPQETEQAASAAADQQTDKADASDASKASEEKADAEQVAGKSDAKKPAIRWQTDLKIAHEISLELNRPMLVVFDADWCSYCRKMERTTLSEPKLISQINNDFVPVHLSLDDHGRIAEILEVKRIPCTVALSPRADLLGRLTGYVGLKQYGDSLDRVLDLHKKVDKQVASIEK